MSPWKEIGQKYSGKKKRGAGGGVYKCIVNWLSGLMIYLISFKGKVIDKVGFVGICMSS